MSAPPSRGQLQLRLARPDEYPAIGRLLVEAYASLPGMPGEQEQPGYYATLLDVGKRAANPAIQVWAAIGASGELLGSVDFIEEMSQYGAKGAASTVSDASGIRLLAVAPEARGRGVGKALTRHCIERARSLGRRQVILHTTHAMQTAWGMYERLGFVRYPEIDFRQGSLEVFGFCLRLGAG